MKEPVLAPTGDMAVLLAMRQDLIKHGWGEMTFRVMTLKDGNERIEISCGRSWVFIIEKQPKFDPDLL